MKEHPILFSGPMIRAILDGRKTQTRRIVNRISGFGQISEFQTSDTPGYEWKFRDKEGRMQDVRDRILLPACPYGRTGDRLWVRETFCPIYPQDPHYNGGQPIEYDYAATYKHGDRLGDHIGVKKVWKPSIHMPRDASRILLEVVSVRVERLQDISEDDAIAEGCAGGHGSIPGYNHNATPYEHYQHVWTSINGADSWIGNPWVWVVEFKRI